MKRGHLRDIIKGIAFHNQRRLKILLLIILPYIFSVQSVNHISDFVPIVCECQLFPCTIASTYLIQFIGYASNSCAVCLRRRVFPVRLD